MKASDNCSTQGKIWVVSEIYYPVTTSTGYYVTEIAEYLAKRGLNVHVICTNALYNQGGVKSSQKEELHNGVAIHRILVPAIDKNSLIKRIVRLLISSYRMCRKIRHSVGEGDKLLVVTNPAFLILLIPHIARKRSVNYTILVHDIFPENLVAIKNIISSSSIFYRTIKQLFDRAYSKADKCISIGRDMSEVLKKKKVQASHITLITNWAETQNIYPKDKRDTSLYKQLKLGDKFVFQFAGNLGRTQGITNLLKALSLIDLPMIHFLFIGDGVKYLEIKKYIHESHLKNVSLLGFQDRSLQNDFLNACDVGIVTLSDGMYGLGVPSKAYNIMAAGKPILYVGEKNSEIALCVEEYKIGWVVEAGNPEALADTILGIVADMDKYLFMKANARKVAENFFAKDIILEKYYSLLSGK